MRKSKIVYQLVIEDFQNVANEMIDRELTAAELQKVVDWVEERMPWYDLIADGINELIDDTEINIGVDEYCPFAEMVLTFFNFGPVGCKWQAIGQAIPGCELVRLKVV